MFHEVRGKGQMVGLVFGEPSSRALRLQWRRLEAIRPALFSETLLVPLFHRHGILTQVAADEVNIIKLLPPLIAGPDEVGQMVAALDDVLADALPASGAVLRHGGQDGGRRCSSRPASGLARGRGGEPRPALGPGSVCAVTGASGFIGSAVTRALLGRGASVRCLVEPGRPTPNLEGLDVEVLFVDVRDQAALVGALEGATGCFHLAALFGFWPRDPDLFYDINVRGLDQRRARRRRGRLRADRLHLDGGHHRAGRHRRRLVRHGGGLRPGRGASTAPTSARSTSQSTRSSRLAAEGAAGGASSSLPSHSVPGTSGPTPTGKVVLDFLNGRMPGYVNTTFNVAHVDDLAEGHLLAYEGRQGASYSPAARTWPWTSSSRASQRPRGCRSGPARPEGLALAAGWLSENVEGRLLGRSPQVPLEAAQMSTTHMRFDDARARAELGYTSRPAVEALSDAARYFVETGRVRPERVALMDR